MGRKGRCGAWLGTTGVESGKTCGAFQYRVDVRNMSVVTRMRIRTLLGPPLQHEVVRAVAAVLVLTDTDAVRTTAPYPPHDSVPPGSSARIPAVRVR